MKIKIGDTLRLFRKTRDLTQKEMLPSYPDGSTYSRIESESRPLKLDELMDILDASAINIYEMVSFAGLDKAQQDFRDLLATAKQNPDNQRKKESLLKYYNTYDTVEERNVQQMANFMAIKLLFHDEWAEVEAVSQQDVDEVYEYLMRRQMFFRYDYALLSYMIFKFSKKQKRLIVARAYPVKFYDKRDIGTIHYTCTTLTNLITSCLFERDFEAAHNYLKLCRKQEKTMENYQFHLEVRYLKNLLSYIETGELEYMYKVHNYIEVLEDIGYASRAANVREEVRVITHDSNEGDVRILGKLQ